MSDAPIKNLTRKLVRRGVQVIQDHLSSALAEAEFLCDITDDEHNDLVEALRAALTVASEEGRS